MKVIPIAKAPVANLADEKCRAVRFIAFVASCLGSFGNLVTAILY